MTIDRHTRPTDLPPLLKPAEVAAYLGIGLNQAYRLVNSGALPSVPVGTHRRVPRHALQEWLKAAPHGNPRPAPAPERSAA